MIDFQRLTLSDRPVYAPILESTGERGCEYSFANLYLWGRQRVATVEGCMVFFSQFNRKTVYPFPVGPGEKHAALEAIIADAQSRDIPCRITGLTASDVAWLQENYPGRFRIHSDRAGYDYVYDIHDLADLKGRPYQKKRNHVNKFYKAFPQTLAVPLTDDLVPQVEAMLNAWYARRLAEDPQADFHMERTALFKALKDYKALCMEGMALVDGGKVLALTLGSPLNDTTFDIHFEKALTEADGAYPAINQAFARYLREKYPAVKYLNREDDMGLEGLRKAKLSYYPHHMVEKSWACLLEEGYEY